MRVVAEITVGKATKAIINGIMGGGLSIAAIAAVPLYGVVVQKLWLWFLVPLGFHEMSLAGALGFTLLAHLLFPSHVANDMAYEYWKNLRARMSSYFLAKASNGPEMTEEEAKFYQDLRRVQAHRVWCGLSLICARPAFAFLIGWVIHLFC